MPPHEALHVACIFLKMRMQLNSKIRLMCLTSAQGWLIAHRIHGGRSQC